MCIYIYIYTSSITISYHIISYLTIHILGKPLVCVSQKPAEDDVVWHFCVADACATIYLCRSQAWRPFVVICLMPPFIRIPRSWIVIIPNILVSVIPEVINNQQRSWNTVHFFPISLWSQFAFFLLGSGRTMPGLKLLHLKVLKRVVSQQNECQTCGMICGRCASQNFRS